MDGVSGAGQRGLYVRLLGRPQLWLDGADVTRRIKYRKGFALLAYLGVHAGEWLTREQVADLLWPELELASARTNLRQVLNNLSTLLNAGGTVLHKDSSSLAFMPDARIHMDIDILSDPILDRLVSNTAEARLWREREIEPCISCLGEMFMCGLQLSGTPEFDAWLEGQRHHFQRRSALLLERICQAQHGDGRLSAAIGTARHLVNCAPAEERHTQLLMTVLTAAGDGAGALDAYRVLERRLDAELGLVPDASLQSLRQQIAHHHKKSNRSPLPEPQAREARRLVALHCVSDSLPSDVEGEALAENLGMIAEMRGGRVLSVLGRGVLAIFGLGASAEWPVQRAVLTARDTLASEKEASPAPRFGISIGQVLLRPGGRVPHVTGDMLDVAQLIGWTAQPGEILVCENAVLHGAEWFRFESVGEHAFPGMSVTRKLYRLAGDNESVVASARPFGGRETELAQLQRWWGQTVSGQPTFAVLRASAGMGKTRLAHELARLVAGQGGRVRHIQCRLAHQHEPLAAVLSDFGGVDHIETGSHSKWEIFDEVFALLDGDTRADPVLLLIDDLHWSDPATRELVELLARRLGQRRIMLLITTRPEVALDMPEDFARVIDLPPLAEAAGLAMIAACDSDNRIPIAERVSIAAASGGIPLFIERKVRSYLESEHHHAAITDLLQGELDCLGGHKRVIRAAAVLGQNFERRHLRALMPEADVPAALAHALDRRIIVAVSDEVCCFWHTLIRDAAYGNIPSFQRRQLQARVAKLL